MTITPSVVLNAKRWSSLGLPKTSEGLRTAQRSVHPDVCKEAGAHDAFIRVTELFHGPDIHTRLAEGTFAGNHKVNWKFDISNVDLAQTAIKVHTDILNLKDIPVEWVARASLSGTTLTTDYGTSGWYFLSDFPSLNPRDVGWIIRRLYAIVHVASRAGWIHGNIIPSSIVVLPSEHGVRLDGWWTAAKKGEPITVKPDVRTPTRYLSGAPADTKMSVGQIAATMLSYDTSDEVKKLLTGFRYSQPKPNEALEKIDAALLKDFGKPSWHDLPVPTTGEI